MRYPGLDNLWFFKINKENLKNEKLSRKYLSMILIYIIFSNISFIKFSFLLLIKFENSYKY
jgi:hypothetical protein